MGRVALQGCLSEDRNFQTVPKAMLTLWGLAWPRATPSFCTGIDCH